MNRESGGSAAASGTSSFPCASLFCCPCLLIGSVRRSRGGVFRDLVFAFYRGDPAGDGVLQHAVAETVFTQGNGRAGGVANHIVLDEVALIETGGIDALVPPDTDANADVLDAVVEHLTLGACLSNL